MNADINFSLVITECRKVEERGNRMQVQIKMNLYYISKQIDL